VVPDSKEYAASAMQKYAKDDRRKNKNKKNKWGSEINPMNAKSSQVNAPRPNLRQRNLRQGHGVGFQRN